MMIGKAFFFFFFVNWLNWNQILSNKLWIFLGEKCKEKKTVSESDEKKAQVTRKTFINFSSQRQYFPVGGPPHIQMFP